MDARAKLQDLINRLERMPLDYSSAAWVGSEEEAELEGRLRSGQLHMAQAVRDARRALASDDDELVTLYCDHCLSLERNGMALIARCVEGEVKADAARKVRKAIATSGGKARGKRLMEDAAALWKPW